MRIILYSFEAADMRLVAIYDFAGPLHRPPLSNLHLRLLLFNSLHALAATKNNFCDYEQHNNKAYDDEDHP